MAPCTLWASIMCSTQDVSIATTLPKFRDTIPSTYHREIKLGELGSKWRQSIVCGLSGLSVQSGAGLCGLWLAPSYLLWATGPGSPVFSIQGTQALVYKKSIYSLGMATPLLPRISKSLVALPGPVIQSLYLGPIRRAGL